MLKSHICIIWIKMGVIRLERKMGTGFKKWCKNKVCGGQGETANRDNKAAKAK